MIRVTSCDGFVLRAYCTCDRSHGTLGAGGFGGIHGMHVYAHPRNEWANAWDEDLPKYWPTNRGDVPGVQATEGPDMSVRNADLCLLRTILPSSSQSLRCAIISSGLLLHY